MSEKLNWDEAKAHIDFIRRIYTEIGAAGIPALTITINPLLVRYERGERTEELHKKIMELSE